MTKATRVEIPAYTDRWMMGDRYGEVIVTYTQAKQPGLTIARIKLDKSGKTVRVLLDDCTEV